ncbi:large ribosomal subunit protein mL45-like [Atheta coriaria]|uniref:large ribosomal subunit protein mL45-like n=1 Tax=Dalotia coriaria TaxID=877792 RepID=UPI0031F34842
MCLQHGLRRSHPRVCLPALQTSVKHDQVRYRRTKHWNPKWKQLRRQKVIKVDLPDFNEKWDDLTEEQTRSKLKEQGLLPPRPWLERPFFLSSTGGVFEAYVPPEGDGKVSPISVQGAKQSIQFLEKKTKTMMAIRKIRTFDEDFDTPEFCKQAEAIYIKSHECLAENGDIDNIIDYVTERAYPEVVHNSKGKTIRWKHLKNIELPRVVHARCTDIVSKENVFAQLTVRFHTQQMLAIYDRFGRLMHGSEILAKDVLEYVVFEKHLANEYGKWRVHYKIIPDWMPPREPSETTYKKIVAPVTETPEKVEALEDGVKKEKIKEIAAPAQ